MKLYILDTPFFHIDGGAYFGVVPKIIWEKKYPADDKNMCKAACRSILVVDGKRKILFDTGIGDKPQKDSNDLYFIDYSQNLIENLKKIGYSSNDITDVVLTHLHFDHCGGCFVYDNNQNKYSLHFKNALYHVTKAQWNNALNPNDREKSSYFPDKIKLLNTEGNLNLVEKNFFLTDKIELRIFNGHTPGLMLPIIKTHNNIIFFTGDLIPAKASIPLAWISAYDLFPLTSVEEKKNILNEAVENNWILLFQHDYYNIASRVTKTEKGVRGAENLISLELMKL